MNTQIDGGGKTIIPQLQHFLIGNMLIQIYYLIIQFYNTALLFPFPFCLFPSLLSLIPYPSSFPHPNLLLHLPIHPSIHPSKYTLNTTQPQYPLLLPPQFPFNFSPFSQFSIPNAIKQKTTLHHTTPHQAKQIKYIEYLPLYLLQSISK